MSIRNFSEGPEHKGKADKPKLPTDTFAPNTLIVGDFVLTKLPYDHLLITHKDGEAMETTSKKFAAVVKKFWAAEF
jgi:hypothetical protein